MDKGEQKDFRDTMVWQRSQALFLSIFAECKNIPPYHVNSILVNQIIRSASSVSANIAEGFGRRTRKDYEQFLVIARGSVNETIDWLEKLKELKFINQEKYLQLEKSCREIRIMLSRMLKSSRTTV